MLFMQFSECIQRSYWVLYLFFKKKKQEMSSEKLCNLPNIKPLIKGRKGRCRIWGLLDPKTIYIFSSPCYPLGNRENAKNSCHCVGSNVTLISAYARFPSFTACTDLWPPSPWKYRKQIKLSPFQHLLLLLFIPYRLAPEYIKFYTVCSS